MAEAIVRQNHASEASFFKDILVSIERFDDSYSERSDNEIKGIYCTGRKRHVQRDDIDSQRRTISAPRRTHVYVYTQITLKIEKMIKS